MNSNKHFLIWGCGGLGREVNVLCETLGYPVAGFLDERPHMKNKIIDGVRVLGDLSDLENSNERYIVAFGIGDPALRKRLFEKTISPGFEIAPPLIHPNVVLSKRSVKIGAGSIISPGCAIMVNVQIGKCVVINQLCSIGHDLIIQDFVTISPSVAISGNVNINEGTYIGVGASVREKINIGAWSVIGGGAFVREDVPDKVMVMGVPASIKKSL